MARIYALGEAAAFARSLNVLHHSSMSCTSFSSSSGSGSQLGVSVGWECSNAEYFVIIPSISAQSVGVIALSRCSLLSVLISRR